MGMDRTPFTSRREMIKRTIAGAAGLAGASLAPGGNADATPRRRPNVIIYHTDDQDYNTLSCFGANVLTPNSDSLGSSGVIFTRGYTTTGVCTASRYALMSGQYPSRCQTPQFKKSFPKDIPTEPSFNTHLADGQANIASVLKEAGYTTGFAGKWDIGGPAFFPEMREKLPLPKEWGAAWKNLDDDLDPSDPEVSRILKENQKMACDAVKKHGFDYAACVNTNPESYRSRALNYHNPEWITKGALDFIDQASDEPFFLYLNHTLHHIPHPQESLLNGDPRMTVGGYLDEVPDVMPSRKEIYDRVVREGYPPETAYCTWMDEALGAVLRKLSELGISDDTMIMFISDNNVPDKATIYEGGVRVPCMIRYPRMVPGGRRSKSLIQSLDFAPTLFNLCGAKAPDDMQLDGKDVMPMLTGERERIHDEIFCEIGWTRSVCTEDYKYLALRYPESAEKFRTSKPGWIYHGRALEPHQHHALLWHPAFYFPDQLYDMRTDPKEVVNLSENPKYADVLSDMKGRLGRWLKTFDNPFGEFN